MSIDIPAYFEDIEPFHEIEFDSLIKLTDAEKSAHSLLNETHKVPEPKKFSFLQHTVLFFAIGIDSDEKVKSAVLIIDDAADGTNMFNDLITYNGEPDLVLTIQGEALTADNIAIEGLRHKSFTWRLGQSAMTFSLFSNNSDKQLTRIHLRIIE
jgi:hypothetical protein